MSGCVRPGKTCHWRILEVWIPTDNNNVGLRGKSSLVMIVDSVFVEFEIGSIGGEVMKAVLRDVEYRSASSTRGSITGE